MDLNFKNYIKRSFDWELDHPPYSPDLAPSAHHLFLHLKMHLGGQLHDDHDPDKMIVLQWLSNRAADM